MKRNMHHGMDVTQCPPKEWLPDAPNINSIQLKFICLKLFTIIIKPNINSPIVQEGGGAAADKGERQRARSVQ